MQAERWQDGFSITSAPLYYDGLVITGFAGAELGVRGRVKAYDARDGKLVWTFYTIPGPASSATTPGRRTTTSGSTAARTVWQTPAVDPELGLIYFSTGNPGPDFNGARARAATTCSRRRSSRSSAKTGKYRWHFQQVHHDIWDYDAPNPVVLFDVELDGAHAQGHRASRARRAGSTSSTATTGKPLVGIDEQPGAAGAAPSDGRDAAVSRAATRSCRSRSTSRPKASSS